LLLELDELFEELFEELLLLELEELLDDRLDELLLERLLLELAELLDDRLPLLLADELDDEFDDELAELLLLELDELFEAPSPPRPPPLRGPLMSERLLLLLDDELDDELDDRLPAERSCRPPRSSVSPTAAAAVFMPRSQPLKNRCTGVSPRGAVPRCALLSEAWTRGVMLRSAPGSWRNPSRNEGRAWACTLAPVIRAATAAARVRRGCFMRGSTGLNKAPGVALAAGVSVQRVEPAGYSGRPGKRV
jgi:hypothetical protein